MGGELQIADHCGHQSAIQLRSGRPGTAALRAAVDSHLPALARCANGLERDFVLLCERFRLPPPEPNVRVGRHRPDMLWREAKLIVAELRRLLI